HPTGGHVPRRRAALAMRLRPVRFRSSPRRWLIRCRLTVGRWALDPAIEVRILAPEPPASARARSPRQRGIHRDLDRVLDGCRLALSPGGVELGDRRRSERLARECGALVEEVTIDTGARCQAIRRAEQPAGAPYVELGLGDLGQTDEGIDDAETALEAL